MTTRREDQRDLPVLDGPELADDALVFELRDEEAAKSVWDEYMNGADVHRGVSAACEYVMGGRPGAATLTALYGDRAPFTWKGEGWELAVPGPPQPDAVVNLTAAHHLRFQEPADGPWLLAELTRDRRVKRAYRPAIQYPLDAPLPALSASEVREIAAGDDLLGLVRLAGAAGLKGFAEVAELAELVALAARDEEQWGLGHCRFPLVWDALDEPAGRPGIAVIDQGGDTGHPDLLGRITEMVVTRGNSQPSTSVHASAVAAVIAALRDPPGGMAGCCSAPVELYNVWTSDQGFDSLAFFNALQDVAKAGVKVVNLSLGSRVRDPVITEQVRECIKAGNILVAAAGNNGQSGNRPLYPAAYDDVIAVGATNPGGNRAPWSAHGSHVRVSAPGLHILSTLGKDDFHFWSGTSFAAPMVSAAVWLALNGQRGWKRAEIEKLLASSSTGRGRRVRDLGFGRLDMEQLGNCVLAGDAACGAGQPAP